MKKLKSGVIYHGGSIDTPSHLQKGIIRLDNGTFSFQAEGKSPLFNIDIRIPEKDIISAKAEERKYYSSVGYFLILEYLDNHRKKQKIDLEIRSFIRRGRAQAISRLWAEILTHKI